MTKGNDRYEMTFEERPQYLYASVKSQIVTLEMALAYVTEIAEKRAQLGTHRLMIHRDIPASLPEGAVFVVIERFVELVGNRTRTAVVNEYAPNESSLTFAELVAENRGAHLRIFKNMPDAERWLVK